MSGAPPSSSWSTSLWSESSSRPSLFRRVAVFRASEGAAAAFAAAFRARAASCRCIATAWSGKILDSGPPRPPQLLLLLELETDGEHSAGGRFCACLVNTLRMAIFRAEVDAEPPPSSPKMLSRSSPSPPSSPNGYESTGTARFAPNSFRHSSARSASWPRPLRRRFTHSLYGLQAFVPLRENRATNLRSRRLVARSHSAPRTHSSPSSIILGLIGRGGRARDEDDDGHADDDEQDALQPQALPSKDDIASNGLLVLLVQGENLDIRY